MPELELFAEANRQLTICNACRYCEGFCPVFKAVETRRDFARGDVLYLANLCHDCRACFYACMFTPPHEFAINIPKLMSDARVESYAQLSWPKMLGQAFRDRRIAGILAFIAIAAVIVTAAALIAPGRLFWQYRGPGAFYEIVPYAAMVIPAVVLFLYGFIVWLQGAVQFMSKAQTTGLRKNEAPKPQSISAWFRAIRDALELKYLGGGGPGCSYPEERPSSVRRVYHSLVFWGFLSAFLSTTLAFLYQDIFHILPPFALTSAPVIFGTLGGVGLTIGTAGLLWFKIWSDRTPATASAYSMDYVFLVTLGLSALTGMLALVFRETRALGSLLILHLALIAALFVTAPYGKFVHFVYRILALVRYQIEERQPHERAGH